MPTSLNLTKHAWDKILERKIPFTDVDFTLKQARGQAQERDGEIYMQYYHPSTNLIIVVAPRSGAIVTMSYDENTPEGIKVITNKGIFYIQETVFKNMLERGATKEEMIEVLNTTDYCDHKDAPDTLWSFYNPKSKVAVVVRKDTKAIVGVRKV